MFFFIGMSVGLHRAAVHCMKYDIATDNVQTGSDLPLETRPVVAQPLPTSQYFLDLLRPVLYSPYRNLLLFDFWFTPLVYNRRFRVLSHFQNSG